jgi:hypothetical protein
LPASILIGRESRLREKEKKGKEKEGKGTEHWTRGSVSSLVTLPRATPRPWHRELSWSDIGADGDGLLGLSAGLANPRSNWLRGFPRTSTQYQLEDFLLFLFKVHVRFMPTYLRLLQGYATAPIGQSIAGGIVI